MTELTMIASPSEPEKFDFNSPEDVLIKVVGPHDDDPTNFEWGNWSIESTTIIRGVEGITGAASYEYSYGAGLDYTIEAITECPGEGWFVVEGITGHFTKGDGWMTDDDMDFYHNGVRPATEQEVSLA